MSYIFGIHTSMAFIKHSPERVLRAYVLEGRHDDRSQELIDLLRQQGIAYETHPRKKLDQMTSEMNHQGIVLECEPARELEEAFLDDFLIQDRPSTLLLVLDGVQDPHNLGACLRTADAVGVDAIILPKDRSVGLTNTVRKVASGAAEVVPVIRVTNLARCLRNLKSYGIGVWGTSERAEKSLFQARFSAPMALVMGGEDKGLRRLTQEQCDECFSIPMQGSVDSLNVSVAAAVSLYEIRRQFSL